MKRSQFDETLPANGTNRRDTNQTEPARMNPSEAFAATLPAQGEMRPAVDAIPPVLAERFEAIEFLGQGGMGTVYRARDRRLGRSVAIKLIHGGGPEAGRRFLLEARAQARIEHENICRIYEAGSIDGAQFIVMQLIHGEPLDRAGQRMTVEQRVKALQKVTTALHEAHRTGLIHRDIKPGNIMVERGDDGAWTPYLMDFGLARETGSRGQTMTGVIAGTPAFMAPEQARGDIQSLDRRTDIYSLGATLYDLIASHPPFVEADVFKLLRRVAEDDAPPLRSVARETPLDLETIVMKCLEREPSRRYESARALADDLGRYLDGEPVHAHRASIGYLLLRKAKKHRLLLGLGVTALVVAMTLVIVWVRARRVSAERALISQQLGRDAKEIELLLRWAYALPLHDIRREKDRVREKMADVQRQIDVVGDVAAGPGYYALGSGYLALREPSQAYEYFAKADVAGYRGPDLERAVGRALGEIYKRELEKTNRIGEEKPREARRAAIEKEILEPALAHLRNGGGEELESAAFMEGLIAFYQKQYDVALEKARLSEEKALSTYEAKKLRADVYSALGTGKKEKGKGDEALADYDKAAEAYAEARSMARSDATVYEAECEMWAHRMEVESNSGKSPKASFEKALAACDGALVVNPESAAGHGRKAWALWQYGLFLSNTNEDPTSTLSSAIAEGQTAIGLDPSNASDHDTVGNAHVLLGFDALYHGRDPRPSFRRGCEVLEKAIALHPNFAWAQNDLGKVYIGIATYESSRGIDPRDSLRSGRPFSERAIEIDPSYTFPYTNLAASHLAQAQYELRVGEDPTEAIRRSIEVGERSLKTNATFSPTYNVLGGAALAEAQLRFSRGEPIELEIQKALAWLESGLKARSDDYDTHLGLARVYLLMAEDALSRAQGAGAALARSDAAMKEAEKTGGQDPAVALGRAQLAIVRARAITSTSKSADEARRSIEEAEAAYAAARKVGDGVWEILAAGAELSFWSACEARKQKKSAKESIRKGLAMVDEALAISAQEPALLAWKGSLSLLLSRVEQGAIAEEALRNGKTLLDGALRKNSFLVRKWKAVEAAVGER